MSVDTILVPTDGGVQATKAIEVALNMAAEFESNVIHALFVVDSSIYSEPALSFTELLTDEVQSAAEEMLTEFRTEADSLGVTLETTVAHGTPKETIIEQATALDADLIVIGSRSDERLEGEGSLCRHIASHAPCNVLVV